MAENGIAGYLQKRLLYAFIINAFTTFLSVQVVYSRMKSSFEGNQAVTLVSLFGVLWSLCLTICSTTILLNVYPSVREDKIYVFFWYYVLPLIAALIAGAKMDSETLPAFFTATIPFFISQTVFYLKFLKLAAKL